MYFLIIYTDELQQVGTSATPTGGELPLPKILVNSIPPLPTQPAVLPLTPGGSQLVCSGCT